MITLKLRIWDLKKTSLLKQKTSNNIQYSSCWDDPKTIQKALQINNDDTILSITSSGCNILNFLMYNPKKIYAIDYNPNQNYLLKLKIEAIKKLKHTEFLELIGVISSDNRKNLYDSIKNNLDGETQNFWDNNSGLIIEGITYNGKIEKHSKMLGYYLRFLNGKKTLEQLFNSKTIEEQEKYFYEKIYDFSWRLPLIIEYNPYFSRLKLSYDLLRDFLIGKNPPKEYFIFIKKLSYSLDILNKMEQVFTKIPLKNNYFASLSIFGYYLDEEFYLPYLKKDSYKIIKERVNRIEIKTSDLAKVLVDFENDEISKFNLSNVLDWVDKKEFIKILQEISRVGKHNARLCYFSTRVDRFLAENFEKIKSEQKLSNQLLAEDRISAYDHLEIGKIIK